MKDWIIVSLGGSLIAPDAIDTNFISQFADLLRRYCAGGYRFIVITGGGKTCRRYQAAAKETNPNANIEDLDWVGIYATRLNGMLMRIVLKELADSHMVTDHALFPQTDKPIVIGAGWEPGWSTDFDAVSLAHHVGAKTIVNLSNIDHVYDSDPKINPNAVAYTNLSWEKYRSQIPGEWSPGLSTPFDPIAALKAQGYEMEVIIMNGDDLTQFDNFLSGKDFDGTRIH